MLRANKTIVFLVLTSILLFPLVAYATKVGSFNQILGQVEQLKGGKPPGSLPKVNDAVVRLDVINTQAQSRAEIILLDNSLLTVAPGSHVTIEEYMYEGKKSRNIVVNLLSGFLDVVVTKASSEGEFIVKTQTATMGIRGSWSKVGAIGGNALFAQMAGTAIVRGAGGGPATTLSGGMINAVVGQQIAPPTMMTPQNIATLNQASFTGFSPGMTIGPNIQQTLGTMAKFKPAAPAPAAAKTMTKSEAKLMNAGLEAKIQALTKDASLAPALANAAIGTTISDSVQVATAMGMNTQSAVTEATQAATQGAIQAGATVQQAVSAITPVATQTALTLGLNAQSAVTATTQGSTQAAIQSGLTPQQAVSVVTPVATQNAVNMGLSLQSAVTATTQGSTQAAIQSGLTPQQAVSVVTPVATQNAVNMGMTPSAANNAVSAGEAAATATPTPTTAPYTPPPAPEPPAPPAGPTGTGGIGGGGGGGGGGASPSS